MLTKENLAQLITIYDGYIMIERQLSVAMYGEVITPKNHTSGAFGKISSIVSLLSGIIPSHVPSIDLDENAWYQIINEEGQAAEDRAMRILALEE